MPVHLSRIPRQARPWPGVPDWLPTWRDTAAAPLLIWRPSCRFAAEPNVPEVTVTVRALAHRVGQSAAAPSRECLDPTHPKRATGSYMRIICPTIALARCQSPGTRIRRQRQHDSVPARSCPPSRYQASANAAEPAGIRSPKSVRGTSALDSTVRVLAGHLPLSPTHSVLDPTGKWCLFVLHSRERFELTQFERLDAIEQHLAALNATSVQMESCGAATRLLGADCEELFRGSSRSTAPSVR